MGADKMPHRFWGFFLAMPRPSSKASPASRPPMAAGPGRAKLMPLRRLSLQHVRSIEDLNLSFECDDGTVRKWTILLGENGTGKSTVLRAIALLLAGSEALPELIARPESYVRNGFDDCRIAAEVVTAEGEERNISLSLHRADVIRQLYARNADAMEAIDRAVGRSPRNYFTVGYGTSRRLARGGRFDRSEEYKKPRAQSVATLFNPDASLKPLQEWAIGLHYRSGRKGLSVVRHALKGLLPDVSFKGIDRERAELLFDTPDGVVPLDRLSDGYQNVAAWCGDLLYRITSTFKDYRDPLSARGLLLIDEIDLHLHPVWQRQLRAYLDAKLPNFQIIATTHSPLTAQQAGPGELFVLRRPGPGLPAVLHQFEGEPRKLMLHQLLLTPLFGVETVDSDKVETERQEYERLKKKRKRSAAESRRLGELREELADLPDWGRESPHEKRQRAALERIEKVLANVTRTNGAATAAAPGETGSSRRGARRSRESGARRPGRRGGGLLK